MGPAEAAGAIHVEVVWAAGPHDTRRVALTVPAGTTAGEALAKSGLLQSVPAVAGAPMGIWGRGCEPGAVLRDGDRVELYRGLTVDPKEARRLRHRRR